MSIYTDNAFPQQYKSPDGSLNEPQFGLTKLEYLTAAALPGICANINIDLDKEHQIAELAVSIARKSLYQCHQVSN